MQRSIWLSLALGLTLVGARTASATDYWDAVFETDSSTLTNNELYHGSSQQHDVQAEAGPTTDEDWYIVYSYPQSSYEAVIDSTSAGLDMWGLFGFQRLDSAPNVVQTSEYANVGGPGGGYSVALRWQHLGGTIDKQYLRLIGGCGNNCGPNDQYHIRFYDTTVAIPRFNNFGGQITVLLIQNPMAWTRTIDGTIYFWGAGGTLLDSTGFSLPPKAALILNTTTVPGVAGTSGTITVAHDGGYGNLALKSVAVEPATGFSFDSPGLYKPR